MLFFVVLLFCFVLRACEACGPDPSKWTPHERAIYECLRARGWTNPQLRAFYKRVFNPHTHSVRASRYDVQSVAGCVTEEDFIAYGVIPEGYATTTLAPSQDSFIDVEPGARAVLLCLRNAVGLTDAAIRAWYNRVLNPSTRSGRVSIGDQGVAAPCISSAGYLAFGVNPDGYATTPAHIAATPRTANAHTFTASTAKEQRIFDCLRAKGWTEKHIETWYNRVLNPATSTGRATRFDQDQTNGCVDVNDYLYYGVNPDGYTPKQQQNQPAPATTTVSTSTLPHVANALGPAVGHNARASKTNYAVAG